MVILITGGAGYIGSHAALLLALADHEVVVLDDLSNGSREAVKRVAELASREVAFVEGDVRDADLLKQIFAENDIDAVMHFAGAKAVGESVEQPLKYFDNNVGGSIVLCQAMAAAGVYRLIFSSSATVYGDGHPMPLHERLACSEPTNPYGRSKLMVEWMLADLATSDPRWRIGILRYFNPVGAHESGRIGESPRGKPNNLLPFVAQVAIGQRETLTVYGNDYATKDGTGVRDYIHVMDLVEGHLAALEALPAHAGFNVWNLGTGRGYSVLEIVRAFERASERTIDYRFAPRRQGDIASCWSDPGKARAQLGWSAKRDLATMLEDAWRWQQHNPQGY